MQNSKKNQLVFADNAKNSEKEELKNVQDILASGQDNSAAPPNTQTTNGNEHPQPHDSTSIDMDAVFAAAAAGPNAYAQESGVRRRKESVESGWHFFFNKKDVLD